MSKPENNVLKSMQKVFTRVTEIADKILSAGPDGYSCHGVTQEQVTGHVNRNEAANKPPSQ